MRRLEAGMFAHKYSGLANYGRVESALGSPTESGCRKLVIAHRVVVPRMGQGYFYTPLPGAGVVLREIARDCGNE